MHSYGNMIIVLISKNWYFIFVTNVLFLSLYDYIISLWLRFHICDNSNIQDNAFFCLDDYEKLYTCNILCRQKYITLRWLRKWHRHVLLFSYWITISTRTIHYFFFFSSAFCCDLNLFFVFTQSSFKKDWLFT